MHLFIRASARFIFSVSAPKAPYNRKRGQTSCPLFSRFETGNHQISLLTLAAFAGTTTQVEQLCAADLALTDNSDLLDEGAVDGEDTLDADAVGNAANGKGLCDAAVLLSNDGTLESLDTLALAFLDTNINADGIADVELGLLSLDAAFRNNLQCVHFEFLHLF